MIAPALVACSLALIGLGSWLGFVLVADLVSTGGESPWIAYVAAGVVITQGAFTLLLVSGLLDRWRANARTLFVTGETLAVLIGTAAAVQGFLYNLNPRNGDFEFGPMMLGAFMAAHAVVGLFWAYNQVDSAPARG